MRNPHIGLHPQVAVKLVDLTQVNASVGQVAHLTRLILRVPSAVGHH